MKVFFYNLGYFILEAFRTIRFHPLSNLFSFLGTGFILFLFGLVLTGWAVGDELVGALEQEAQVSAYFADQVGEAGAKQIITKMKTLDGVWEARYVTAGEAYAKNRELLGNEAEILRLFDNNPFEAFVEIKIDLNKMDQVLSQISSMKGIEYVRDNRDILEKLKGIVDAIKLLGGVIAAAVGITTLVIISHMIRQGIYHNKEQINTLRLLGAPNSFIAFPFVMAGLLLTLLGGGLAAALIIVMMNQGYQSIGEYIMFLPLPPAQELCRFIVAIILGISAALGLVGSLFGVSSIQKEG
ncbi:MAG: hypothetical protein K0S04_4091 [Herbinix sp.]|jgi:cell division transport system permease protein|nr:hypothetical protein [Herbinix sp.]